MTDINDTNEQVISPAAVVAIDEAREEKRSQTGRRVLTIVLIILILLLCGVGYFLGKIMIPEGRPAGEVGGLGWVRSIYGYGTNADELTNPSTIAIDKSNGNFWVADPGKYRIVEYAPDGTYVRQINKPPGVDENFFRIPSKIAMDSDGLIFVGEPTYGEVRVFQRDGTEEGMFQFPTPLSIDVNDDYIVIGTEGGFGILDKLGNPLQIIGQRGRTADDFDMVNGVFIDEDNIVYVVDTFNNRLSAWTVEGEKLWIVDTGYPQNQTMTGDTTPPETDAAAELQVPMGITMDGNGRIAVADMFDFSIALFDKENGSFITKFGEVGLQDGQLFYPSDVDYDPIHDWFVVADNGAKRAQIITIPDSGGGIVAKARQGIAGPLKACCFPLLLIIAVLVVSWIVGRLRRKRRIDATERQPVEVVSLD